ncbi:MAG: AraC family transcriptional regulator [Myxococcaceae bacterium]|nr:AraC family transcriptional regulator [Myxococcaceae bacterium]
MARASVDPSFTFRLVPLVLRLLEARAVPAPERARLLGLLPAGAATAAEVSAPLSVIAGFLQQAAQASPAPSLGLELAGAVPRGTYAWLEFIARLSPSLEAGMQAVSRYYRLINRGGELVPVKRAQQVGLEIVVPGRKGGWGRELNEYTLALFHRIARELVSDWAVTRVWFSHADPGPTARRALQVFFGVAPEFAQRTSGFEGPAVLAAKALGSADPALLGLLQAQADAVLAQQAPLAVLGQRVREEICARLGKAEVGIEAVAPALGLTPRTLQRKLKDEDLGYQALLDGARAQFAKGYLADPRLSVSEIAFLLGYSELRAFDRAFRRWTGASPMAWREQSRR